MTEALVKNLSEHIHKGAFDMLSTEEARERVEAGSHEEDDTYIALLTDNGPVEVYGLGTTRDDVLDYGSDLLYGGRIPTAVIHWDGSDWDTVEVEYTMRLA